MTYSINMFGVIQRRIFRLANQKFPFCKCVLDADDSRHDYMFNGVIPPSSNHTWLRAQGDKTKHIHIH